MFVSTCMCIRMCVRNSVLFKPFLSDKFNGVTNGHLSPTTGITFLIITPVGKADDV
jgi:hypothetical protein